MFSLTMQPRHFSRALLCHRRICIYFFLREDGERNESDKVFMRHASLKKCSVLHCLNFFLIYYFIYSIAVEKQPDPATLGLFFIG